MAKQKFQVLYPIGQDHKVGDPIEIDPESANGKRLIKAGAIARPEDLAKAAPAAKSDDGKLAELEEQAKAAEERAETAEKKATELEEQAKAAEERATKAEADAKAAQEALDKAQADAKAAGGKAKQ